MINHVLIVHLGAGGKFSLQNKTHGYCDQRLYLADRKNKKTKPILLNTQLFLIVVSFVVDSPLTQNLLWLQVSGQFNLQLRPSAVDRGFNSFSLSPLKWIVSV